MLVLFHQGNHLSPICVLIDKTKVITGSPRLVKFVYSEKATKFWEIFNLLLSTVHAVKSKVKISHNFVAFSEYIKFTDSQ